MKIWKKCRQELLMSYVFAFYLEDCNQKYIFEMNQLNMERAIEKLSMHFEQAINLCLSLGSKTSESHEYISIKKDILQVSGLVVIKCHSIE